jgi:glyoxylase-like metal-dependent hydrolase (beta-lactamase superfamily II)
MPRTFSTHEVGPGVWAAAAPRTTGAAVSNAAIIDLGDRTLVVDTFMTAMAAEELASEIDRLTGRAPFLVVNSHWHADHVRGNQVFGAAPIVGTQRMRELILADAPKTPAEFDERRTAVARAARDAAARAETPQEHAEARWMRELADALAAQAEDYRLVLPDLLIADGLVVESDRTAHILNAGRGHTESDLFVFVPDAGVVVAGDLVWNGVHPKTDDGFPEDWVGALRRIAELGPSTVVPGHGEPATAAVIAEMAGYLQALVGLVTAVRDGEVDPRDAELPDGSTQWAGPARFHAGLERLSSRG